MSTSAGTSTTTSNSGAGTLPTSTAGRNNLISMFQSDWELTSDPKDYVPAFKNLGVTMIRSQIHWSSFAPDPKSKSIPAHFNPTNPNDYPASAWKWLDTADRTAAANDVKLYLTLQGPGPQWALAPGAPPDHPQEDGVWKPSPTLFRDWVQAMGTRYSGNFRPPGSKTPLPRINDWALWNEPNYGVSLAPETSDHAKVATAAENYRKLVNAGWQGLEASGHTPSNDTIVIGETAPRGIVGPNEPGPVEGMVPLRFIRALYCVNDSYKPLRGTAASSIGCPTTSAKTKSFASSNPGLFKASGWADHPYPDAQAPNVSTETPGVSGYADFANLDNLASTLDKSARAYGQSPKLLIYNSEFGYQSPNYVSGAQAAAYMNETEYLSWRNPRIASYDQYLLRDTGGGQPNAGFLSGLMTWNSHLKPTYAAYVVPLWMPTTKASSGTALEVWGCARPAPATEATTHAKQTVDIQYAKDKGGTYKTVKTVTLNPKTDGCYFDTHVTFPGSGDVRLEWSGNKAMNYSRVQPITLN